MRDYFTSEQKERISVGILVIVALLRFVNLGFLDLQAWDEAIYAVRAEGILRFGGFLDQTPFAIGGLYSSFHPPLYVWLTSLSFALFGVTEFAARFFSAFFGGLTILVIYRIGRNLQSKHLGFLAAMIYALNPFVTVFARQGQFDTTLVFFLSLCILLYQRMEADNRVRSALLAGLALGLALMTKLFVGLGVPLAYVLWRMLIPKGSQRSPWSLFVISLGVSFIVAAPWHIYMTLTQGAGDPLFFLQASSILDRSLHGIEGNAKPLEGLYYVNQLVVLFSFGVIWFGYGLYRIFKTRDPQWLLLASWFTVYFVVFTLMRTKLDFYLLPMLVPASLISGRIILESRGGVHSEKVIAWLILGTGISVAWASSQTWRYLVKYALARISHAGLPGAQELLAILPFLLLLTSLIILLSYIYRAGKLDQVRSVLPTLILVPLFILTFYNIVWNDRYRYKDGASELARFVDQREPSVLVVAGFDRNPQLSFYLEGADMGWRDDLEIRRVVPPADRRQFKTWLSAQTSNLPIDALVVVEKDKFIRYEWVTAEEVNPLDYSLVFDSRRYAVFQRLPSTQLALNPRQPL